MQTVITTWQGFTATLESAVKLLNFIKKKLRIREKNNEVKHEMVAECYNNLVSVKRDIGKLREATDLFVIREKFNGEEHR